MWKVVIAVMSGALCASCAPSSFEAAFVQACEKKIRSRQSDAATYKPVETKTSHRIMTPAEFEIWLARSDETAIMKGALRRTVETKPATIWEANFTSEQDGAQDQVTDRCTFVQIGDDQTVGEFSLEVDGIKRN